MNSRSASTKDVVSSSQTFVDYWIGAALKGARAVGRNSLIELLLTMKDTFDQSEELCVGGEENERPWLRPERLIFC